MKFRTILILLVIASALFIYYQLPELRTYKTNSGEAQALAVGAVDTQAPPPTPTATVVPTMTVGYQETAIVAQATAMEAVRVNAQVTAEYERRVQEQLQMTAQADREWFMIQSWTQQAASTVIPLTATQQAAINTQIPLQQIVALAQLTATYGAPTQVVAMAKAEQAARYSGASQVVQLIGLSSVSLFCLVLVAFLIFKMRTYYPQPTDELEEEPEPTETVVMVRRDNGGGMGSTTRQVIPCTPEQLTELAELAVNGERTFAINRLESNSRTLNRTTLYEFRNWAVSNGYAMQPKPGKQEIALNDEGLCFLEGWFENHQLPDQYRFGEGGELGQEFMPA